MAVRTVRTAALACLLWSALASAALGQEGPAGEGVGARLDAIQEMVLYARYPEAIEAAQGLLAEEGLSARQRNAALEVLATAQLANRDEDAASETLRRLYARDPGHRLSDPDASPLVQSAFARARTGTSGSVEVALEHESPGTLESRESPVIEVRLGDNADAVDEMRVSYRYQGEPRFSAAVMSIEDGVARTRIPLRGGDGEAYSIEYYVEAVAPSRASLETLGSEAEPLSLTVPARTAPAAAAILGPTDDPATAADDEGGSIAGEWWFWTAIGVVVAGGVVAALLVAGADDGPPDGSLGNVDLGLRF